MLSTQKAETREKAAVVGVLPWIYMDLFIYLFKSLYEVRPGEVLV